MKTYILMYLVVNLNVNIFALISKNILHASKSRLARNCNYNFMTFLWNDT